ncbi:hypothetical protein [Paraburkholderia jirisanensis]
MSFISGDWRGGRRLAMPRSSLITDADMSYGFFVSAFISDFLACR